MTEPALTLDGSKEITRQLKGQQSRLLTGNISAHDIQAAIATCARLLRPVLYLLTAMDRDQLLALQDELLNCRPEDDLQPISQRYSQVLYGIIKHFEAGPSASLATGVKENADIADREPLRREMTDWAAEKAALTDELTEAHKRMATLEKLLEAAGSEHGKLKKEIKRLETRPAEVAAPVPDLTVLEKRIAAMEQEVAGLLEASEPVARVSIPPPAADAPAERKLIKTANELLLERLDGRLRSGQQQDS